MCLLLHGFSTSFRRSLSVRLPGWTSPSHRGHAGPRRDACNRLDDHVGGVRKAKDDRTAAGPLGKVVGPRNTCGWSGTGNLALRTSNSAFAQVADSFRLA